MNSNASQTAPHFFAPSPDMAQPSPPFVWSVGSSPESFFQRTPLDIGYPTFLHQQQVFPHQSPSTANSVTRSPYYDASPIGSAPHPPHPKPPFPYGNRMAFDLGADAFVSYPSAPTFPVTSTHIPRDQLPQRTVYVGNLPKGVPVDELLDLVCFGPLESVRVISEKACVFISFLDAETASAFHADATIKRLSLRGQELKVGWGKPSPVGAQVLLSITQSNASRNVYLGSLDSRVTEDGLRSDLSRFGPIDQVRIVHERNIAFVHFLSITTASKVVATLPTEPAWAGKRIGYGKDRCAYRPKSHQAAQLAAQVSAAHSLLNRQSSSQASPSSAPATSIPGRPWDLGQGMNRTVYLGNIHPETTTEDLCNTIRGGLLQSIKHFPDKHTAFVTFVDPTAAFRFFQTATFQGIALHNRRLKVGWGKNSGPLPPALALAIHSGATRNVYVGNIENFDVFSEERLTKDFSVCGEIELVNFFKEKNCAFVNFTAISSAMKALETVKARPEYKDLRLSYGKDRCANPPRSGTDIISLRKPRRIESGLPVSALLVAQASAEDGEVA